jgi:hypothetical protein
MMASSKLPNPKIGVSKLSGKASWYPYYAGFSSEFARAILAGLELPSRSRVLDPWNGSGTTTEAALNLGLDCVGYDLNPAMVVISKARLLSERTKPSLVPLAREILAKSLKLPILRDTNDPLTTWLHPATASAFRRLERSVLSHLVSGDIQVPIGTDGIAKLSDIAAFYYTALFRTLRSRLKPFFSTNPTWIKCPKGPARAKMSGKILDKHFMETVQRMAESLPDGFSVQADTRSSISFASSEAMPLSASSVDCVLTSPPYCTRIDYAVATRPELAVLGFGVNPAHSFRELRESLTGTTTVSPTLTPPEPSWGSACTRFLEAVRQHPSKASGTYYYKQHLQYFHSIYTSLSELSRVVKADGACTIVVQDSHYKELHNPLPEIFFEMATSLGFTPTGRSDFPCSRNFARLNPHARKYRANACAVESVLTFTR